MEAKVIGTHVTKFFHVDKLEWSKQRGKAHNLSLNSYQNKPDYLKALNYLQLLLSLTYDKSLNLMLYCQLKIVD